MKGFVISFMIPVAFLNAGMSGNLPLSGFNAGGNPAVFTNHDVAHATASLALPQEAVMKAAARLQNEEKYSPGPIEQQINNFLRSFRLIGSSA